MSLRENTALPPILGFHHITAIASDPQRNLDFYAGVLGQRFTKRTVNFDDPGTYHFYFGDETGSPGTSLTFFPWPGAKRGVSGAGFVTAIAYLAPVNSINFWEARLIDANVLVRGKETRFGQNVLTFVDPDGLTIEIVESERALEKSFWKGGGIDAAYALRAFHSVTINLKKGDKTIDLLENHFGFKKLAQDDSKNQRTRFLSTNGDIVDLVINEAFSFGESGAGTVHHLALIVNDDDQQLAWREHLNSAGFAVTEVRDRYYFHSVYFRERGGVLFELATPAPGFAIDEPVEALGAGLKLPAQYEKYRDELFEKLTPLKIPTPGNKELEIHAHLFQTASEKLADNTFLMLHGTGGTESSLLSLGRALSEDANLLSPRGNVVEGANNRFFRRIREGVFDLEDLEFRAMELNRWLSAAKQAYSLPEDSISAIGFSNGANIAGAMLLKGQASFKRAALLCAMPTFEDQQFADLKGKEIFILAGKQDPIVPFEESERLAEMFKKAGAEVTFAAFEGGHSITAQGLKALKGWIG